MLHVEQYWIKIQFHVEQYIKLGSKNSHSSTIIIYEKIVLKPYLLYENGGVIIMAKDEKEKKTYKQFRIGTNEQISNTLQRLINAIGNQTMSESQVRLMNELIKTKLQLIKVIEQDQRIAEIERILGLEDED